MAPIRLLPHNRLVVSEHDRDPFQESGVLGHINDVDSAQNPERAETRPGPPTQPAVGPGDEGHLACHYGASLMRPVTSVILVGLLAIILLAFVIQSLVLS